MNIKTKRCLFVCSLFAVATLYATAAYRVEQTRMAGAAQLGCIQTFCIPHGATFTSLR